MTRFAKEIGIPANLDSNLLLEEAAHLASKLGHGFVQTHKEKVEQVSPSLDHSSLIFNPGHLIFYP